MTIMDNRDKNPRLPGGLGLGSWAFSEGYWEGQDRRNSIRAVAAALRGGIRLFDTAPAYGNGQAEQLLGQQLRRDRGNLFLSSKFYPTLAGNVEKGLNRSLKRLMTDHIDGYYIHWPNEKCDMPAILSELEKLKTAGLIGHLGVSNFSLAQLKEARRHTDITLCQGAYSLAWPLAEEELIPYCREEGIDFVAYSPLAQGLLLLPPDTPAPRDGRKDLILLRPPFASALESLRTRIFRLAEQTGRPALELVLSWVLGQPGVSSVLGGARSRSQVEQLLQAAGRRLSPEIREEMSLWAAEMRKILLSRLTADENPWGHRQGH